MNFRSESDIDRFLGSFKAGTLPSYCWTHAAHLAMCAARLWIEDGDTVDGIRLGIQQYLVSQGMPASAYHEALTLFWIEARESLGGGLRRDQGVGAQQRPAKEAVHF